MSGRNHQNYWRTLTSILPPVGEGCLLADALRGGIDTWLSYNLHFGLGCAALLGYWVARRMTRVLAEMPVSSIASARPGFVALKGRAQPLPNVEPLQAPSGEPCVWYYYRSGSGDSYYSIDSPRPFLLVDDSGQCLIDPIGASFSRVSSGHNEDMIRAGDRLYVAGQLRPYSAETLVRTLPPEPLNVSVTYDDGDDAKARRELEHRMRERIDAQKRRPAIISLPALPIVSAPDFAGEFVIVGGDADNGGEGDSYRLLAYANAVTALVSAVMLDYLQWMGLGWSLDYVYEWLS